MPGIGASQLPTYQITQLLNCLRDSQFGCDPLGDEGFHHVALLHIVEVADSDAALHAVAHLTGIIFEAPERTDFAFVNLYSVAEKANVGVALDYAIDHVAAGDRPDLRHFERIAYFGASKVGFLDDGLEQAGHGFLHLR